MRIDLIKKISAKCKSKEDLLEKIEQCDSLYNRANTIRGKMRQLKEDYDTKLRILELELTRVGCAHFITNYQSDPAGGSDSSNTCEICGKEVR